MASSERIFTEVPRAKRSHSQMNTLNVAIKAAAALELEIAGVDLLQTRQGARRAGSQSVTRIRGVGGGHRNQYRRCDYRICSGVCTRPCFCPYEGPTQSYHKREKSSRPQLIPTVTRYMAKKMDDTPKKILMFNHEFPPIGGGGGWVSYFLGKHFAAAGHDVHLITSRFRDLSDRRGSRRFSCASGACASEEAPMCVPSTRC